MKLVIFFSASSLVLIFLFLEILHICSVHTLTMHINYKREESLWMLIFFFICALLVFIFISFFAIASSSFSSFILLFLFFCCFLRHIENYRKREKYRKKFPSITLILLIPTNEHTDWKIMMMILKLL